MTTPKNLSAYPYFYVQYMEMIKRDPELISRIHNNIELYKEALGDRNG